MKYTLRHLEIFLAVARCKNTNAAAQELHLSQSAVSAALLNLEKTYDIRLFDRSGKRLLLNQAGLALRKRAESLLSHAREFETDLTRQRYVGDLKIGASFTIGNHLWVNYLAAYLEEYPDADAGLTIANSPEIIAKVLNYEVDLGMVEYASLHKDLELIPWLDDELVVFCSPEHPLARKRGELSARDISEARWILREPESAARKAFESSFIDLLPDLTVYLEFRHNEAIKRAVEARLGIGCLSQIVLQSNFKEGSLIPLSLSKEFQLKRKFFLVLAVGHYKKYSVDSWINICVKSMKCDS